MSRRVFISYRRDDAKWEAREIYRSLTQVLPRDHVFMDVDSIPPGADFVDVLEGWVDECDILLALIGSGWVDAMDPKSGHRRLENPNDFVRIEVRKALERGIPVVPVLLDGAPIPDADRLPDDLKKLTRRNAEFVEHRTVDTDVEHLIRRLGLANDAPSQGTGSADSPVKPTRPDRSAEGRIKVDAAIFHGASDGWFMPGAGKNEWFQDIKDGPEMVLVPVGSFLMGSPEGETGRQGSESPQHSVTFSKPFAIGRHTVTRRQFTAFVHETGHNTTGGAYVWTGSDLEHDPKGSWRTPGLLQDDNHPVVCVSWDDASAYAAWLSKETGKTYRLPSEAEWEYAARAGTTTPFWWGVSVEPLQAKFVGAFIYEGGGSSVYERANSSKKWRNATVPVWQYVANPWGLFNMHGNCWEWCDDVWHDNYSGAPSDGSPWLRGGVEYRRVNRGGSWNSNPNFLRSASRGKNSASFRNISNGFRLARTLTP